MIREKTSERAGSTERNFSYGDGLWLSVASNTLLSPFYPTVLSVWATSTSFAAMSCRTAKRVLFKQLSEWFPHWTSWLSIIKENSGVVSVDFWQSNFCIGLFTVKKQLDDFYSTISFAINATRSIVSRRHRFAGFALFSLGQGPAGMSLGSIASLPIPECMSERTGIEDITYCSEGFSGIQHRYCGDSYDGWWWRKWSNSRAVLKGPVA